MSLLSLSDLRVPLVSSVVAALLLLAAAAHADVVYLKDGSRIEGEIVAKNERVVRLRIQSGRIRMFRMTDVSRIVEGDEEDDAPGKRPPPRPGVGPAPAVDPYPEDTALYERQLRAKLGVAAKPHVVVRGDMPLEELKLSADAAELTFLHFLDTFDCGPSDVLLRSRRTNAGTTDGSASDTAPLEVFLFRQENAYQRFMDRVFDRMRDETVNDQRFALMKRQRGFWILSPRPVNVGWQGPSPLETVVATVSHKTSHTCLMLYEPAGAWMPWWFLEGFAAWQEIQITGSNLTYCLDLARPGDYVQDGTPEADEEGKAKTEKLWRQRIRQMCRTGKERDFRVLGKLSLNELLLPDVIQSWSVVDWLSGQRKLKEFTLAYKEHRDLSSAFQAALGVPTEEAYHRWKKRVLSGR